jgi:hypothetical protein
VTAAQAQGITCPIGYWPSGHGCEALPPLTAYVDGAINYTACTASQYVPSPGTACTTCTPGQACSLQPCSGISANPTMCTPCDPLLNGDVCNLTSVPISPRQCPSGYYVNNGMCQICPEGKFCATPASAVACAAKTYSGFGYIACLPCPAGYDCSTSSKLSEITQCAAGKYSNLGDGTCTSCALG